MERLNAWLEKNGFIGVKAEENDVFAYNMTKRVIYMGKELESGVENFPEFLDKNGCDYAADVLLYMLAFLHELGHFNTIHSYSEMELLLFDAMKIVNGRDENLSIKEKAFVYWSVPDEWDANNWEIQYLMNEDNFPALNELYEIMEEIYA